MHFGTGNYNFVTSQSYEDIGLFTCNASLGEDCGLIFNSLTAYANRGYSKNILVAPEKLQDSILDFIKEQKKLKEDGYIFLKLNNITDPFIIRALNDASKAGVEIDIIVRGICSLKPSKNIRIKSILGQFLEHSRIYSFGKGSNNKIFIGSADMNETDLEKLDGITNGTAAANKALVLGASKEIATITTATITNLSTTTLTGGAITSSNFAGVTTLLIKNSNKFSINFIAGILLGFLLLQRSVSMFYIIPVILYFMIVFQVEKAVTIIILTLHYQD